MDELNGQSTTFKKIDREIFDRLDKFKLTPGYNNLQDFYNGLEEEQQRLLKAIIILILFLLPISGLGIIAWQNNSLKEDLQTRIALVSKANEVLGHKQGLENVTPSVLSMNPIEGDSMMTSRLSNLVSASGLDLSKIQVSNFVSKLISDGIMRSEADFSFTNISTDELMNLFSAMITREKFKIQSVEIVRNADTNLLQGQFHAIHLSDISALEEEE